MLLIVKPPAAASQGCHHSCRQSTTAYELAQGPSTISVLNWGVPCQVADARALVKEAEARLSCVPCARVPAELPFGEVHPQLGAFRRLPESWWRTFPAHRKQQPGSASAGQQTPSSAVRQTPEGPTSSDSQPDRSKET